MITRADAFFGSGPLRPLEQFQLEERERVALTIATLDDEFQREFGTLSLKRPGHSQPQLPESCGPEFWNQFLDLSTL